MLNDDIWGQDQLSVLKLREKMLLKLSLALPFFGGWSFNGQSRLFLNCFDGVFGVSLDKRSAKSSISPVSGF